MAVRSCQYSPGTVILMKDFSLFHMKFTASVTKKVHQDRGPSHLHLSVFFLLYMRSSLLLENK